MTVHVSPVNDLVSHETEGCECVCGPDVEFFDPSTGDTYASGPLVIHHSLDGREVGESLVVI